MVQRKEKASRSCFAYGSISMLRWSYLHSKSSSIEREAFERPWENDSKGPLVTVAVDKCAVAPKELANTARDFFHNFHFHRRLVCIHKTFILGYYIQGNKIYTNHPLQALAPAHDRLRNAD